jgi:NAD-dependent SIR2 family protein deacetylase
MFASMTAQVNTLKTAIEKAGAILIGAGSGLSIASGLSYNDVGTFSVLFPNYHEHYGLQTINEALYYQFPTPEEQYAFLARFIYAIRYNYPAGKPYQNLYHIIKNRNYFILSTNTDGQFLKSGFTQEKIYSPQGDYAFFQCSLPCNNDIYLNEQMIKEMLLNIAPSDFRLPIEHIPHCPNCGSPLIPNIRNNANFVERHWIKKHRELIDLINVNKSKNILLFELGVGTNTPSIIRYPFEQLTLQRRNTTLLRINLNVNNLSLINNSENATIIQADIGTILAELAKDY